MYAVIAGAGEVGFQVARFLYEEGYNIALVEKDEKAVAEAESLDALVVKGNAASPLKLKEAGIETADLFIGVTGSDEANIIGSAIAKSRGAKTIARINSFEYINEPISTNLKNLGIDVAICPELVAARKLSRMMSLPVLMDVETFARGKLSAVEVRVKKFSRAAGKQIKDLNLPPGVNIVALFRAGEVIMPYGEEKIRINDRLIIFFSDPSSLIAIDRLFSPVNRGEENGGEKGIERIMIVGATRMGVQLAKMLEKRVEVILLDEDEEACARASEALSSTLVIRGSGTDEEILVEEGIGRVDVFVAATHHEDTNILSSLLAKEYGAKKCVAIINRPELKSMFEHIGVDVAVSPRLATVGAVLQHTYSSEILAMGVLFGGKARVVEMEVKPEHRIVGKTVGKVHLPKNTRLGAIVRGNKVIIPGGDDMVMIGDHLIFFAPSESVQKVERIMNKPGLFL